MMHQGEIIFDVEGDVKREMTVLDLLDQFEKVKGAQLADRSLLQ